MEIQNESNFGSAFELGLSFDKCVYIALSLHSWDIYESD